MLRAVFVAVLCLGATVSTNPFCAGALHVQQTGQDAVMPPEGNPDHVQPPNGAYCDHSSRPAHSCACHAMCVEDSDGNVSIQEDGAHCRANCYKKHCHCPTDKCQSPAAGTGEARTNLLDPQIRFGI